MYLNIEINYHIVKKNHATFGKIQNNRIIEHHLPPELV